MFHAIIIYQHIHKHSILSEKQQENHLKRYLLKITKFCRFSLFSFIIVCFIYLVRHILCKINNIHLRKEGLQCPAEIFSEWFQVTSIIVVFEVFEVFEPPLFSLHVCTGQFELQFRSEFRYQPQRVEGKTIAVKF